MEKYFSHFCSLFPSFHSFLCKLLTFLEWREKLWILVVFYFILVITQNLINAKNLSNPLRVVFKDDRFVWALNSTLEYILRWVCSEMS